MANLPLIAWHEVPEGHYVWLRFTREHPHAQLGNDWMIRMKGHGEPPPQGYEFARAEQQPGEWAAKHQDCVSQKTHAHAMRLAERHYEREQRLRDGLATLEQRVIEAVDRVEQAVLPDTHSEGPDIISRDSVRASVRAALREGR